MNAPLPTWLERWLGVNAAQAGEGTVWSLQHAWALAPWLTVLMALGAAALVAGLYTREAGDAGRRYRALLTILRLTALALVALMIAEFVLSLQRTGLPYVVIAIDDSASMSIVDRYDDEELRGRLQRQTQAAELDELSRINLAKALLLNGDSELLRGIARRYKLKVYFLSDAAREQAGGVDELTDVIQAHAAEGQSSQLGTGVRTILNDLRGTPPTAVIVMTDGVTTEGETLSDVAAYARRKRVPLYTVALGSDVPVQDLELSDLLVDEVVFVDDLVNFEFKLTGQGFEGKQVEVILRQEDQEQPLARTTVTVGPDGQPQSARLTYRPTRVGEYRYVLEVAEQTGEVQTVNNRRQCAISVRKEQIRVLLVQAYPNYEFRYLKNMLERDHTIELKTLLQEADPEYTEADKTAIRVFPARREALFEYDVVIFGDVNPAFLSTPAQALLADFVREKGGGLVMIAGPLYTPAAYRNSPLAALLPIDPSAGSSPEAGRVINDGFVPLPTELGLASPPFQLGDTPEASRKIWQQLPDLYWLYEAGRLKPGAQVLAEHPARLGEDGRRLPVISMQYAGAGKVLFHATDDTWRWRFRVGDVYFARYWVQTIRYLSRLKLMGQDRLAELIVDRREYRQGEPVRLRVRFADERQAPADDNAVGVVIEQPNGQKQQLQLVRSGNFRGIFEGQLDRPAQGAYHAWLAAPAAAGKPPSADFLVVAPPGELAHSRIDVAELTRAAEETRGRFFRQTNAQELLDGLPAGRQVPVETLPPIVLWNRWPLLALCLAALVFEWLLRKRVGML